MNRRQMIRSLALTAVGIPVALAGTSEAATGRKRDALRVGESMRFDRDLKITFLAVSDDSRCPINAACISAGNAEIVLRIEAGNQPTKNYRLNTDSKPRQLIIPANVFPPGFFGIPKSYGIEIDSLNPLPTAGQKTRQAAYRLRLRISVAV